MPELVRLADENPHDEQLCRQLMLALYRCGRQADALARYQALRRRLVDELGIDPGPAVRDLEARILLLPRDHGLTGDEGQAHRRRLAVPALRP